MDAVGIANDPGDGAAGAQGLTGAADRIASAAVSGLGDAIGGVRARRSPRRFLSKSLIHAGSQIHKV